MAWINSFEYHETVSLLRSFFLSRGFIETEVQSRRSILAACEDPYTMTNYNHQGMVWPLPQKGQMRLEHELLNNPNVPGFFCISTSYRQEPNPVPSRHETIFPLFEFEAKGDMDDLRKLESELIETVGLGEEKDFVHKRYHELIQHYGTVELTSKEEKRMEKDFSHVTFLTDFPLYASPFRNIKKEGDIAKKIDIILYGIETIGSAERSSDPKKMKELFYTMNDGAYAKSLFDQFGKKRVEDELNEFLSMKFFPRCGGAIGITRMIRALKLHGILKKEEKYYRPQFMKQYA